MYICISLLLLLWLYYDDDYYYCCYYFYICLLLFISVEIMCIYIYIHIYIYTYIQTYNMYDIYIYIYIYTHTVYTVYIYIQWDIPQLDWDHHFQAHPSSVEALVPLADVFNHRCQKVPKGEAVREVSGGKRWRPWRDERMDHGIPK